MRGLSLAPNGSDTISPRAAKLGVSSGKRSRSATSTTTANSVNPMNGPVRPSPLAAMPGRIRNGASAGPITVPSPKLDATIDSALVRSARLVRLAT
jgi:hypothetical protein